MKRLVILLGLLFFLSCATIDIPDVNYRQEMINFVIKISNYAKNKNTNFGIFPQNGSDLLTNSNYVNAITGIGQEDLYYGYDSDGVITPSNVTDEIEQNLDILVSNNKLVLVTNYPFNDEDVPNYSSAQTKIDDSYSKASTKNYVNFCTVRNLNYFTENPGHLPSVNSPAITDWSDISEFLYILQAPSSMTRTDFLNNLSSTNYDLIIMDYSYDGSESEKFTNNEISTLKSSFNGLVIAYMSIGEAENYRYYWNSSWDSNNDGKPDEDAPYWLYIENPDWEGNYKVFYWEEDWQDIIIGYLDKLIEAGFDGVYLDIIDAYEYYEVIIN